ncbi:MAG: hypothetical protein ACJ74Y_16740 [Bryobacteraceae bacterium]
MALFTDSDVVTLDDLLRFESSLVQISSTHGIDVETKIRLASDEIGDKILLCLLQTGAPGQWTGTSELGLENVVVSSPLYRWICFNSLARIYAEAYNVQLNTRFQGKWNEYQQQASQAFNLVMASGVGVVAHPLPKPGLPTISVSQGTISAPAIFAQVSWIGHQSEDESAASPVAGAIINGAATVQVAFSELGADIPSNASGWNVYAGTSQVSLGLQTETPLRLDQSWHMPSSGAAIGRKPSPGQSGDFNVALSKRLQRG